MLDKIKTMLGQITPGPWEHHNWDEMEKPHVVPVANGFGKRVCDGSFDLPRTPVDAEFIALSPEFARWAVQEIERLREALSDIETLACMNRWNAIESIEERAREAIKGSP